MCHANNFLLRREAEDNWLIRPLPMVQLKCPPLVWNQQQFAVSLADPPPSPVLVSHISYAGKSALLPPSKCHQQEGRTVHVYSVLLIGDGFGRS